MTTITGNVGIGGGSPPDAVYSGKSWVLYWPFAEVNTTAKKTILALADRKELAARAGIQ